MKQLKCSYDGIAEIALDINGIEQFASWVKKPRKIPEDQFTKRIYKLQLYDKPGDIIRAEVAEYEGRKRGL